MKLNIGEYTVEVKAKGTALAERNNLMDTIFFLNKLSLACSEAADSYKAKGYNAISEEFDIMGTDIYAALKAAGAYKEV